MKLLTVILASLLALIQYPLWVGQGSWLRVWELDRQLTLQQEINAGKRMRNEGLEAEVADLRSGTQAIEERARYELGMIKQDEIFVQFNGAGSVSAAPGAEAIPAGPGKTGAGRQGQRQEPGQGQGQGQAGEGQKLGQKQGQRPGQRQGRSPGQDLGQGQGTGVPAAVPPPAGGRTVLTGGR